jgi:hypothetical protein
MDVKYKFREYGQYVQTLKQTHTVLQIIFADVIKWQETKHALFNNAALMKSVSLYEMPNLVLRSFSNFQNEHGYIGLMERGPLHIASRDLDL